MRNIHNYKNKTCSCRSILGYYTRRRQKKEVISVGCGNTGRIITFFIISTKNKTLTKNKKVQKEDNSFGIESAGNAKL